MIPIFYHWTIPSLRGKRDLNPQPLVWQTNAWPIKLFPLQKNQKIDKDKKIENLGKIGFEPMKNKFGGFTVHCFWPLSHFPSWTEKEGIEPTQQI
jgi:hypothetical protein